MPHHHLVIGASRGIGYELVLQLLDKYPSDFIVATVRDLSAGPIQNWKQDSRVILLECDVTDVSSVQKAAKELSKHTSTLESIIANAGVQVGHAHIFEFPLADFRANLDTNVLGCFLSINGFLPFLLKSTAQRRSMMIMTSILASMNMAEELAKVTKERLKIDFMPAPAWQVCQAARNMLGVQYALELNPKNIAVCVMSPGWVKTEMGGPMAKQNIDFSVAGMLETLDMVELKGCEFRNFHQGFYEW